MKKKLIHDGENSYYVLDEDLLSAGLRAAVMSFPGTERVEITWEGHVQLFSLNIYPHPRDKNFRYMGTCMGSDERAMQAWLAFPPYLGAR